MGKEKSIEQKLVRAIKGCGGIFPKLFIPGLCGMADCVVATLHAKIGDVEVE